MKNELVLRPLSLGQPMWASTRTVSHSGFLCDPAIQHTLPLCAYPVLKYTGWHVSRQYYRNGRTI